MSHDAPHEHSLDPDDLALGLDAGFRYRCDQCGNVTRFDVEVAERTRRYLHFDLGGDSNVDEQEVLTREVASVTCRWCGRADAIRVEAAPAAAVDSARPS